MTSGLGDSRKNAFWLALAAAFLVDFVSKEIVFSSSRDTLFSAFRGLLEITRTVNTGAVFGIGQDMNALFTFLTATFLVVAVPYLVEIFLPRFSSLTAWIVAGTGCGGVLGNYLDRLAYGHVRDFILVWRWPVFNLADSFIVLSFAVLIALFWFGESRTPQGGAA